MDKNLGVVLYVGTGIIISKVSVITSQTKFTNWWIDRYKKARTRRASKNRVKRELL